MSKKKGSMAERLAHLRRLQHFGAQCPPYESPSDKLELGSDSEERGKRNKKDIFDEQPLFAKWLKEEYRHLYDDPSMKDEYAAIMRSKFWNQLSLKHRKFSRRRKYISVRLKQLEELTKPRGFFGKIFELKTSLPKTETAERDALKHENDKLAVLCRVIEAYQNGETYTWVHKWEAMRQEELRRSEEEERLRREEMEREEELRRMEELEDRDWRWY